MKLYDPITKDSIIHEVYRTCGADTGTYSLRDVIARVNNALDRYFHIAFGAQGKHIADDTSETSAPIFTQNIVSGTNEYKISEFSDRFLNLIKLTVLDDDGIEQPLIQERMSDLTDTFLQTYKSTITGRPDRYLLYGDFIYLRPYPDYSEANGLRAYSNRSASKFDFDTCTQTIADPSVFTAVAHGLAVNDTVMLETDGALAANFSVDTVYYVKLVPTDDTFQLAATLGGTAIEGATSQSGIHYFTETSKVPGIPLTHHSYLARQASIPYLTENNLPQLGGIMKQVGSNRLRDPFYGGDELEIEEYFSRRNMDTREIIKPRITPFR